MILNGKKLTALLFVLLMVLMSAVACNDSADGEKPKNGGDAAVGHYIEYNGTKIELGKKADSVIDALGEANAVNEIGDCGGLGAQVRYDYSSFLLYVLESDSGNIIDQITLKDDLVETDKGICIGDEESAVRTAYGEPDKTQGARLLISSGFSCSLPTVLWAELPGTD